MIRGLRLIAKACVCSLRPLHFTGIHHWPMVVTPHCYCTAALRRLHFIKTTSVVATTQFKGGKMKKQFAVFATIAFASVSLAYAQDATQQDASVIPESPGQESIQPSEGVPIEEPSGAQPGEVPAPPPTPLDSMHDRSIQPRERRASLRPIPMQRPSPSARHSPMPRTRLRW